MRYLAVVARGRRDVYDTLRRTLAPRAAVSLVWDRRTGERRREQADTGVMDDRHRDRRRRPPSTWSALGFVLVSVPDASGEHPARDSRDA